MFSVTGRTIWLAVPLQAWMCPQGSDR